MQKFILANTDKFIYSSNFKSTKNFEIKRIASTTNYYQFQFKRNKAAYPILALDYIIDYCRSVDTAEDDFQDLIFELVSSIINSSSLAYEPKSWDDFFRKDFFKSRNDQRKIGFLILHIISNDIEHLAFPTIREFQIVELLNDALPEIGKRLKITNQKLTFEALKLWKDFENNLQNDFDKLNLIDVDTILKQRESINRFFSKIKPLIQALCPFEGFDSFPEDIFRLIASFNQDVDEGDVKKANYRIEHLEKTFIKILEYDSIYIRRFAYPLLTSTLSFFKNEITELIKPAELSLHTSERRYPFSDRLSKINLKLTVKNEGGGFATNVQLDIKFPFPIIIKGMGQNKFSKHWPQLAPGTIIIDIPILIKTTFNEALIGDFELLWNDWDIGQKRSAGKVVYKNETRKVDWTQLENTERYSTKPVANEKDFIGKESKINPIYKDIQNSVSSSWFYGQKRVGKTSTFLGIKRELEKLEDFLVISTNYGEFSHPNPTVLIDQMVSVIIEEISVTHSFNINIPQLNGSLTPLIQYIKNVSRLSKRKVFLMIDEFDELPYVFFNINEISQPFWQSLRSISMSQHSGILLVGGENVQKLKITWGSSLNLLTTHRADKFRPDEFIDYAKLIRNPVEQELHFTDDAILQIYKLTGGNPFFTKLLCKVIQRQACRTHNSYLSYEEVQSAVNETILYETEMEHFQHFIEDGLKGEDSKIKIWQQKRAKYLYILSSYLSNDGKADLSNFKEICLKEHQIADLDFGDLHNEFIERNIYKSDGSQIIFEIPLFSKFLKVRGTNLLPSFFKTDENLLARVELEKRLFIKDEELRELVNNWGLYQGSQITVDKVRNWLQQFEDLHIQREVFEFLEKIKFINRDDIMQGVRMAYRAAISEIDFEKANRQRLRDDIFISYLDGPGKSGSWIAHQFKDVNGILKQNILELGQVTKIASSAINPFGKMKALVLADDFAGTGKTLIEELSNHTETLRIISKKFNVNIILFVAYAMEEGCEAIKKFIKEEDLDILPRFGEVFNDTEKIFSGTSRYFNNPEKQTKAKFIFEGIGTKLVPKNPLGYGNSGIAIIFPENCPNNALPALWARKASSNFNWEPLFPRVLN